MEIIKNQEIDVKFSDIDFYNKINEIISYAKDKDFINFKNYFVNNCYYKICYGTFRETLEQAIISENLYNRHSYIIVYDKDLEICYTIDIVYSKKYNESIEKYNKSKNENGICLRFNKIKELRPCKLFDSYWFKIKKDNVKNNLSNKPDKNSIYLVRFLYEYINKEQIYLIEEEYSNNKKKKIEKIKKNNSILDKSRIKLFFLIANEIKLYSIMPFLKNHKNHISDLNCSVFIEYMFGKEIISKLKKYRHNTYLLVLN